MNKAFDATARGLRTFASDVADGFFEITHNGFALVGLAIVFAALALVARPDLRQTGEAVVVARVSEDLLPGRVHHTELNEAGEVVPSVVEDADLPDPGEARVRAIVEP